MGPEVFTLDNDDATILQLIDVIALGLGIAHDAEVVSPENEHAIRSWLAAERFRLRRTHDTEHVLNNLKNSTYFEFWNTLEADQEVRWTQTKSATYFVHTGELTFESPDRHLHSSGPWVELRRHTGKTFWSHIAHVRPLP
jgi:hypothetical protein